MFGQNPGNSNPVPMEDPTIPVPMQKGPIPMLVNPVPNSGVTINIQNATLIFPPQTPQSSAPSSFLPNVNGMTEEVGTMMEIGDSINKVKTRKKKSSNSDSSDNRPKRPVQQPYKLKQGVTIMDTAPEGVLDDNSSNNASAKQKLNREFKVDSSAAITFEQFSKVCDGLATKQRFANLTFSNAPIHSMLNVLYADKSTFKTVTNYMWSCAIKDNEENYRLDLVWPSKSHPRLELRNPRTNELMLKMSPNYRTLTVELGTVVIPANKLEQLIKIFQTCLRAESVSGVITKNEAANSSEPSGKEEKVSGHKHPRVEEPDIEQVAPPKKKAKKEKTNVVAEKKARDKVLEIEEKDLIAAINQNKHLNFFQRLDNVLGKYKVNPHTYKLKINCENSRDQEHPFKVFLKIEGFNDFREQKQKGDKACQSWVFKGEKEFSMYCPEYQPMRPIEGKYKYFECRMWQLDAADGFKLGKIKNNKNEISRSWFLFDEQLGEWHTLHKSECKDYPMPGSDIARPSDHMFTLFGAKKILFADSSYKKLGIPMRVWKKILGKTFYGNLKALTESKTCPKDVSAVRTQKEWVDGLGYFQQNPDLLEVAVKNIREYSLKHFYSSILTVTQRALLVKIYNNTFTETPLPEMKDGNPFADSKMNLFDLISAVDKKSSAESTDDVELCGLLCDGISLEEENTFTKNFSTNNQPLLQFKLWVNSLMWADGYYYQITPKPEPMQLRS